MEGRIAIQLTPQSMIPRVGFVLRTHPPHLTEYVANEFDKLTKHALECLAEIKVTPLVDKIRGLPVGLGGLGWTRASDIRKLAFEASSAFAAVDFEDNEAAIKVALSKIASQHQLTHEHHTRVIHDLCNERPELQALLMDGAGFGAGSWLYRLPEWTSPMEPAIASAALRNRLGTPHVSLADTEGGTELKCPCGVIKKSLPELTHHLSGCSKIHGNNSSSAHKEFKHMFKHMLDFCTLSHDLNEPSFDLVTCPECDDAVPSKSVEEHPAVCRGQRGDGTNPVTTDAIRKAEACRPDIRFYLADGTKVVTDLSLTSRPHTDVSKLRADRDLNAMTILNEVCDKKDAKYKSKVEANFEEFVPIIVTSIGTISPNAHQLIQSIADTRDGELLSAKGVRAGIAHSAISVRAKSLHNAERQLGVQHQKKLNSRNLNSAKQATSNPVFEILGLPPIEERSASERPALAPVSSSFFGPTTYHIANTEDECDSYSTYSGSESDSESRHSSSTPVDVDQHVPDGSATPTPAPIVISDDDDSDTPHVANDDGNSAAPAAASSSQSSGGLLSHLPFGRMVASRLPWEPIAPPAARSPAQVVLKTT